MRPSPRAAALIAILSLPLSAAPAAAQSGGEPLIDEGTGAPIYQQPGGRESGWVDAAPETGAEAAPPPPQRPSRSAPDDLGITAGEPGGSAGWRDPDTGALFGDGGQDAAPPVVDDEGWRDPDAAGAPWSGGPDAAEAAPYDPYAGAAGPAPGGAGPGYAAEASADGEYALPAARPAMIGPSNAWVVGATRRGLAAAISHGLRLERAGFPAQIFRTYDGGYDIVMGASDFPKAQRLLRKWRDSGVAEASSRLADGSDYAERVWAADRVLDEESAAGLR